MEPVLMRAGSYRFIVDDFEYVYHKNRRSGNQTLDECLALYIPYKLKIAAAKDAGLDTLPGIAAEWMQYRDQLAAKYLADTIINQYLLREAYDRSRYEIKAAYIQVNISGNDTLTAFNRIRKIRQRALAGEDFGELAADCSDDPSAKVNKGQLGWFTVFRMDYPFETMAYSTSVGLVSVPVRTDTEYRMIKIIDRRPSGQEMSLEEAKTLLKQKIARSDRMQIGMETYAATLKPKYRFTEHAVSLENILRNTKNANLPLFSFAGQEFRVADFEKFVASQPARTMTEQAYKQFVAYSLLDYESSRLESDNKIFRETAGEFLDGLLLFALTDSVIWSKAAQDSTGLTAFYKKNARFYKWGKRMDATIYYCSGAKVAERLHRTVKNRNEGSGRLPDGLFTFFCDEATPCLDTVRRVLPKGANTIADRVKWKKGCSKILDWNGKFVFLDIHTLLRPARKTFKEARGEALSGYQDELESKWVERLKKKYPVTIDEKVWTDLKRKYAE
ncbi:MAG: peptidyl-prolyl cis-trans isomerase [Bacteroidales bacterium]|nr:peptidyl-prolyl cis-trans isomerase [Bacteroidales bacterium]